MSSDSEDSDEDMVFPEHVDMNYNKVEEEFNYVETFKKTKHRPMLVDSGPSLMGMDTKGKTQIISIGPVLERDNDLPSGKNLAAYIDLQGILS